MKRSEIREAILRSRGINARLVNQGVQNDTSAGMLSRLGSAVPDGTDLVILQPGSNDGLLNHHPTMRGANIAEMRRQLAARGICRGSGG